MNCAFVAACPAGAGSRLPVLSSGATLTPILPQQSQESRDTAGQNFPIFMFFRSTWEMETIWMMFYSIFKQLLAEHDESSPWSWMRWAELIPHHQEEPTMKSSCISGLRNSASICSSGRLHFLPQTPLKWCWVAQPVRYQCRISTGVACSHGYFKPGQKWSCCLVF